MEISTNLIIFINIIILINLALFLHQIKKYNIAKKSKENYIVKILKSEPTNSFYHDLIILLLGIPFIMYLVKSKGVYAGFSSMSSVPLIVLTHMEFAMSRIISRYTDDLICEEYFIIDSKKYYWNDIYSFKWEECSEDDSKKIDEEIYILKFKLKIEQNTGKESDFPSSLFTKLKIVELVEESCICVFISKKKRVIVNKHLQKNIA